MIVSDLIKALSSLPGDKDAVAAVVVQMGMDNLGWKKEYGDITTVSTEKLVAGTRERDVVTLYCKISRPRP